MPTNPLNNGSSSDLALEKETQPTMTNRRSGALAEPGLNSSQVSVEGKLKEQMEETEEEGAEEKAEEKEEEEEENESKEDEPDYPTGMKLTIITISLCLSVFLVALVSSYPLIHLLESYLPQLTYLSGQHHHRYRHSSNH
jgi:hypothetical protein